MQMAKAKFIDLTVTMFEIQSVHESISVPDLGLQLHSTLNITNTARERLMRLSSDEDNKDSDFISNFIYSQRFLFGSFVRLNAGEESVVLSASLDQKTVQINEMITAAKNNSFGSIHESLFFCIFDNLLLMSGAKSRKHLETYINWLLRDKSTIDMQYKFIPVKNTANTIPIKEIQSIQFADNYINALPTIQNESLKIKKELLESILKDIKTMKDFDLEDVVSATLFLKIDKRQLKKNNAAALNTALRLIDSDDIVIIGKKGKRIRGTQYLFKAIVKFERNSTTYYHEKEIETQMRNIIKAYKNGEVVT
jgi:hypothetical protein